VTESKKENSKSINQKKRGKIGGVALHKCGAVIG